MDINKMTRKEFTKLPTRKWDEKIVCDSLLIIPLQTQHDSGFGCMDFIAVKDNQAICRLSGMSDVIHLDGIGGYGENWLDQYGRIPELVPPSGWAIDCLPKSGLLRIFPSQGKKIFCGPRLSSFEIYAANPGIKYE